MFQIPENLGNLDDPEFLGHLAYMPLQYFSLSSFVFSPPPPWIFQDRVSPCNPGYPGTHTVDQAGLKLKRSACLCHLSAGTKRDAPLPPGMVKFFIIIIIFHYLFKRFLFILYM
jgi:hypothetical protein